MNFLDHDYCENDLKDDEPEQHVWDDDEEPVSFSKFERIVS